MRQVHVKSKLAAVLLPFHYNNDGTMSVSLIRRTPGGAHGGQLAFPGGKYEHTDSSLLETALRESEEEVGLHHSALSHVHSLNPIHTIHTGYIIHPFAGLLRTKPKHWQIQTSEVEEVLTVCLDELLDNHDSHYVNNPQFDTVGHFPCFRVAGHPLWGASYRMIRPLLAAYRRQELIFDAAFGGSD